MLKLGFLLEGDEEGCVEADDVGLKLGATGTLGAVTDGELEGTEGEPWLGYSWELGNLGQLEGI